MIRVADGPERGSERRNGLLVRLHQALTHIGRRRSIHPGYLRALI